MNKNFYKLIQYLFVTICFLIIFKTIKEEKEIHNIMFNIDIYKFFPAVIVSIFLVLVYSQMIFKLSRHTTSLKISKKKWIYIFLNSQFLDTIPFAGFIYKAVNLKKYNLEYKYFVFVYAFIFYSWIIIYLFLFFIDTVIISLYFGLVKYFYISILFLISSVMVFFFIKLMNHLSHKFPSKLYLLSKAKELIIFTDKNLVKKNILIFLKSGTIIHISEFCLYYLVISFLQLDLSFKIIFTIFFVNSLIDFFPITPKNIGISELISGLLLSLIGFNFTTGVLIRIFIRLSSIFATIILFLFNNIFLSERNE